MTFRFLPINPAIALSLCLLGASFASYALPQADNEIIRQQQRQQEQERADRLNAPRIDPKSLR